MKKTLLILGAALLLSAGVFAQTEVTADPTSSELSGNDATSTNKGYVFNFQLPTGGNDASVANCTAGTGIINEGGSTAYDFSYNADKGYAVFSFDGTQGITGFLWNRLPSGNCTPTTVDIKGTTMKLKANVIPIVFKKSH